MAKQLLFRADGNATTGLGHLYRLFSLVEILKEYYTYIYLTKADSTTEVIPKEYPLSTIPSTISIEEEPRWIAKEFESKDTIIIADGYQFASNYQKQIKDFGFQLVYIDDLIKEHMYADVVINHSPGISPEVYKKELYTQLALGTDYALLRPAFLEAAKQSRTIKEIDTAFVCFGGADPEDLTCKAVKALLEITCFTSINVVLGGAYIHEEIYRLAKIHKTKIYIHKNLPEEKLIGLMKSCNFAVVPTSTILFELFCVKMPVFSGYFVDNQKKAFINFYKKGVVGGNGNMIEEFQKDIKSAINDYIKTLNINENLKSQQKLIDGNQSQRHLLLIKTLLNA